MARYIGPVCRLCRREAMKLFLKGERCYTEKCAIEKRNFPPGQHGKTRKAKLAGYGLQLREKQKVKRIYGVLEDQFRGYFEAAERARGITGVTLLQLLEQRLDNVIYRLGLSTSRPQARQLVRHGHFLVNGKKVDIPSYSVKQGDVITVLSRTQKNPTLEHAIEEVKGRGIPEWLSFGDAAALHFLDRVLERRVLLRAAEDGDDVALLHRVGRDVDLLAVDEEVPVSHELPRLRPRRRQSESVDHVVQ